MTLDTTLYGSVDALQMTVFIYRELVSKCDKKGKQQQQEQTTTIKKNKRD